MYRRGRAAFLGTSARSGQVVKGTPKPVVDKLTALLKEAMDDPDFKTFYTTNNLIPAFAKGKDFTKIFALQTKQVKESISATGN
jgi:putative tricarboxylic transport membrane protein